MTKYIESTTNTIQGTIYPCTSTFTDTP